MKHGKTKEQEAEEVALVQALAEKRLREVCNLFSERNLGQNWKHFSNLDQNWKTTLMLNVKGRDVSDEEEMELLKGEKFFLHTKWNL